MCVIKKENQPGHQAYKYNLPGEIEQIFFLFYQNRHHSGKKKDPEINDKEPLDIRNSSFPFESQNMCRLA